MRTRSCNLLLRQAGSEQPVVLGNWAYLQLALEQLSGQPESTGDPSPEQHLQAQAHTVQGQQHFHETIALPHPTELDLAQCYLHEANEHRLGHQNNQYS